VYRETGRAGSTAHRPTCHRGFTPSRQEAVPNGPLTVGHGFDMLELPKPHVKCPLRSHRPDLCACPWCGSYRSQRCPPQQLYLTTLRISIYPFARQIVLSYFETSARRCRMDRGSVWPS
jgi:hypothetical protein